MRTSGRANDEMREVRFTRAYTCHAEGSVLVEFGRTKVICNASFDDGVPNFQRGAGKGWVTAEYGMLPRSTGKRMRRDTRHNGRAQEIQRLIGRSLRSVVDLYALGENTIVVDCDVIQADGGTRTAAITGAYVALVDAVQRVLEQGKLHTDPITAAVASVSVGVCSRVPMLDLDYDEDSGAETDMNVVMNDRGEFIEIQGTAEGYPFTFAELERLLALARKGIEHLFTVQAAALEQVGAETPGSE